MILILQDTQFVHFDQFICLIVLPECFPVNHISVLF